MEKKQLQKEMINLSQIQTFSLCRGKKKNLLPSSLVLEHSSPTLLHSLFYAPVLDLSIAEWLEVGEANFLEVSIKIIESCSGLGCDL